MDHKAASGKKKQRYRQPSTLLPHCTKGASFTHGVNTSGEGSCLQPIRDCHVPGKHNLQTSALQLSLRIKRCELGVMQKPEVI